MSFMDFMNQWTIEDLAKQVEKNHAEVMAEIKGIRQDLKVLQEGHENKTEYVHGVSRIEEDAKLKAFLCYQQSDDIHEEERNMSSQMFEAGWEAATEFWGIK